MIKQKTYISLILTLFLTTSYSQNATNQFDANGKRHGLWTKNYYQTDQKRYEGTFFHGKEIDTFNFYTLNKGKSVLSAVKIFNKTNDFAQVTFLASKGAVISEGKMNGKLFIGKWIFYHKNSIAKMIEEYYNAKGELDGKRTVFYKNGTIAELSNYKNGKLNGESKWFSESNQLLKTVKYIDNELDGKAIHYDSDGNVVSEGNYKKDKKIGIWSYYDKGKLVKKINHTTKAVVFKAKM